jgi:glycine oxidase
LPEVLIVGAGIAGMLSALELSRRGLTVSILDDPQTRPPASWAGGGILSPLFPWRYPDQLISLTRHALAEYRALAAEIVAIGGPDPEVLHDGMLVLDDPEEARLRQWAGVSGESVQRCRASAHLDWLGDRPAVWLPGIGSIRNPRLLKGLYCSLRAKGIAVRTGRVSGIVPGAQGVEVTTDSGSLRAQRVLITAGAASGRLLPPELGNTVFPVKGQMLLYRPEQRPPSAIVLSDQGYLIPRSDGQVLVGSTVEPGVADSLPTASAHQHLMRVAGELWPVLAGVSPVAQWSGIRPGSHRSLPWIGVVPGSAERVWLNSGHFRNGLVCGPASARLLAALMCGETPPFDPMPYALSASSSSSPP